MDILNKMSTKNLQFFKNLQDGKIPKIFWGGNVSLKKGCLQKTPAHKDMCFPGSFRKYVVAQSKKKKQRHVLEDEVVCEQ
jgi:hypothetical protein